MYRLRRWGHVFNVLDLIQGFGGQIPNTGIQSQICEESQTRNSMHELFWQHLSEARNPSAWEINKTVLRFHIVANF